MQYLELATLIEKLNFFQFNGKFYEQTEGQTMKNVLPPFLRWYYIARIHCPKIKVDDIFCIFCAAISVEFPELLKFTCEEEIDGSLLFLDVRVTRRDSRLERSILLTFPLQRRILTRKWYKSRRRQGSKDIKAAIDRLISEILFKRKIKEVATLSPISKGCTTKQTGLMFNPGLSRKIAIIMAKHDIQMVPKASKKRSQVLR
jgi:hypothetical protein